MKTQTAAKTAKAKSATVKKPVTNVKKANKATVRNVKAKTAKAKKASR